MSQEQQGWMASTYARASTGAKMLFFLTLGLLPLGLIAVFASIESARESSAEHIDDIRARLELKAERVDSALSQGMLLLRAASASEGMRDQDPSQCGASLARIAGSENIPGRYALFTDGSPRCATPGFSPAPMGVERQLGGSGRERSTVALAPDGGSLQFAVLSERGEVEGIGEISRDQLAKLTDVPGPTEAFDLILTGGGRRLVLNDRFRQEALGGTLDLAQPLAGSRLMLNMTTAAASISAVELLVVLLPVLMWLAAALIGWLIVDRLLLKPLARMQRAVAAYKPGDQELALPTTASPAREIGELGAAFARVTHTVTRHEAELEVGLDRQIRLVREVHHRVKNNLQVVASLLNLHARGATSPDASAAYASIQRRVDALAVVHRNHYAELEENRGVALKSLLSELGANLRANAPPTAANMQIRLAVEPVYATQDVAVSVAFLVTELVEFAMFCGARFVTVTMEQVGPGTALLSIESEALQGELRSDSKLFERFDRIVTGLSRQLRSVLNKDAEAGRYALEVAIVGRGDG